MKEETMSNDFFKSERVFNIILGQHLSEKSNILTSEYNQYVFRVAAKANKIEIKKAIEQLFSVKVDSINTTNRHAKKRNFKNIKGVRKNFKKAYVKLKEGYKISVGESE